MSAVNPLEPASTIGGDQRSYEPTMEEILASIRRIIADDQGAASSRPATLPEAAAPAVAEPSVASLHVLHAEPAPSAEVSAPAIERDAHTAASGAGEPMMAAHGYVAAPQFPTPNPPFADAHGFAGPSEERHATAPLHDVEARPASRPEPQRADEYVPVAHAPEPGGDEDGGSQSYVQLFSAQTQQSVASAFSALAATRLADNSDELLVIARDMMRPLLKTWLDDNLPTMVERLVRAEIERVARGR